MEYDSNQKPIIDTDKITITQGNPETDFDLSGYVNAYPDYSFTAKVFDIGSMFGIENGRISKLSIHKDSERVLGYQRGWAENEKPFTAEQSAVLREIIDAFPDPICPYHAQKISEIRVREHKHGRRR